MAIMDDAPYQAWMAAHDQYERAESRWNAANRTQNRSLVARTQADMENARQRLNSALKELNELEAQRR